MSDERHDSSVRHPERRRHPRCKVAVQVELHPEGVTAPLRTAINEISSGGCYVETMFTFAAGTRLTMTLWLENVKVSTPGKVVTCFPQVGNGIEFTGMSVEDGHRLEQFLADHKDAE